MHYRTDIFALYGDLFEETHAELVKQAGLFARMGGAIKNRLASRAFAPKIVEKALDTTARQSAESQLLQRLQAQYPAQFANATPEMIGQQYSHLIKPEVAAARKSRLPLGATPPPSALPAPEATRTNVGETATAGKKGMGLGTLAAVGIPAAGLGGYMLGRPDEAAQEQQRTRTRNIAFGAGAATGLAAPYVIRGLGSLANSIGGQGLYPGMMPGGEY